MSDIRCLRCDKPYLPSNTHGWWHFDRYSGPKTGVFVDGRQLSLTGSACGPCSSSIHTANGFEEAVVKQHVTKRLST